MNAYKQQVIQFYDARTAYDHEEGTQHPLEASLLLESVPLQPFSLDPSVLDYNMSLSRLETTFSQGETLTRTLLDSEDE
jgi:hypothetical protein